MRICNSKYYFEVSRHDVKEGGSHRRYWQVDVRHERDVCGREKEIQRNIIIQEQYFKGVPELTIKYGFFKNLCRGNRINNYTRKRRHSLNPQTYR